MDADQRSLIRDVIESYALQKEPYQFWGHLGKAVSRQTKAQTGQVYLIDPTHQTADPIIRKHGKHAHGPTVYRLAKPLSLTSPLRTQFAFQLRTAVANANSEEAYDIHFDGNHSDIYLRISPPDEWNLPIMAVIVLRHNTRQQQSALERLCRDALKLVSDLSVLPALSYLKHLLVKHTANQTSRLPRLALTAICDWMQAEYGLAIELDSSRTEIQYLTEWNTGETQSISLSTPISLRKRDLVTQALDSSKVAYKALPSQSLWNTDFNTATRQARTNEGPAFIIPLGLPPSSAALVITLPQTRRHWPPRSLLLALQELVTNEFGSAYQATQRHQHNISAFQDVTLLHNTLSLPLNTRDHETASVAEPTLITQLLNQTLEHFGLTDNDIVAFHPAIDSQHKEGISNNYHSPIYIGNTLSVDSPIPPPLLFEPILRHIEEHRSYHSADLAGDRLFAESPHPAMKPFLRRQHYKAFAGALIATTDHNIGILTLFYRTPQQFSKYDRNFFEVYCNYVANLITAHRWSRRNERDRIRVQLHDLVDTKIRAAIRFLGIIESRSPDEIQIRRPIRSAVHTLTSIETGLHLALIYHDIDNPALSLANYLRESLTTLNDEALEDDVSLDITFENFPTNLAPRELLAIMWTVHQSLANALEHAHARTITCHARRIDDALQINIFDDGVGFKPSQLSVNQGMGFDIMKRMIEDIDGTFSVTSNTSGQDVGTIVSVHLPLHEEPLDDHDS